VVDRPLGLVDAAEGYVPWLARLFHSAQWCSAASCATVVVSLSPAAWSDITVPPPELNVGHTGVPAAVGLPVRANAVHSAIIWSDSAC
jgi:hypothetical protein